MYGSTWGRWALLGRDSGAAIQPPGASREVVVAVDDPRATDIRTLLEAHLAFSREATPPAYSFALEVDKLAEPAVTFFSARMDGSVVGVGALKRLDDSHAEIKSMHTSAAMRGRGVGRAVVEHIIEFARARGYQRVSIETGTSEVFAPARALYAGVGFEPCAPFGDYTDSPYNTCMTMVL
jgi:putative acetyltransferase